MKAINEILTIVVDWLASIVFHTKERDLRLVIPFEVTIFELRDEVNVEITIHKNRIIEDCILR